MSPPSTISFFFFFNDTATTEIYTLSLHDALPISQTELIPMRPALTPSQAMMIRLFHTKSWGLDPNRSEEHTSELQSRLHLVCRLLLEKKKKKINKEYDEISRDSMRRDV